MTNDTTRRVLKLYVGPESEPIFCQQSFTVEIDDEGAGEFVVATDNSDDGGSIRINPEDWPMLRAAIQELIEKCKDHGQEQPAEQELTCRWVKQQDDQTEVYRTECGYWKSRIGYPIASPRLAGLEICLHCGGKIVEESIHE